MSDFFSDVRDLTEKSPLYGSGQFVLNVRYAISDEGALFEMIFFPNNEGSTKITAKWLIDLPVMHEEGGTHRELVQKGLSAIQEAYVLRGYP